MQETLINHPKLQVVRRTGSEGPSFDPYHFEEIAVTTPHNTATLHFGLGDWATLNGKKVEIQVNSAEPLWTDAYIKEEARALREDFLQSITGFTLVQIERIAHRLASRCRKCGGREFNCVTGYPGEYLDICEKCGHINGSQFYLSEIE